MTTHAFSTGEGANGRRSHAMPALATDRLVPQSKRFVPTHFPFQPLPQPNGPAPYRYDLSRLLPQSDIQAIKQAGKLVFHSLGDTGDFRGQQKQFVAQMMTDDAEALDAQSKPAFCYHLGDVVYFAGDIDKYGDDFYATYQEYPAFIVAIPGNHDCQPDDPQDGAIDPNKVPLDGYVQNFMSKNPHQLGSFKTGSGRTQMDLPNVYWTFITPLATIIGLFSNVSETEGELHQDQIDWFHAELTAADKSKALIVAIHHPPFSGDTDHSGSSAVSHILTSAFAATGVYPHIVLSGHVHNYQRFLHQPANGTAVTCLVSGNGGYTRLGRLQKVNGSYPTVPQEVDAELTLEQYDHERYGFLRIEVSETLIEVVSLGAQYAPGQVVTPDVIDHFKIDLASRKVTMPTP
ncbi:MAG: metallophosphoesterase [Ancalomicrobiaceae bacterium]|nr:metallophosphoesterase [Ancalomicrobiaceae bacterium]